MLISIATPVYDMNGKGIEFLEFNLNKSLSQKVNFEIEIIISDQSNNNEIEEYIKNLNSPIIKYFKDPNRGNHSCNTNNAILKSNGDIIKILYQDDYFLDENSLQITINSLINSDNKWLVSACEHSTDKLNLIRPFYPRWNDQMLFGNNTYSAPSVVSIKKEAKRTLLDENIYYMPDVEYYFRMKNIYGDPLYLNTITIVNSIHENQTQNLIGQKMTNDIQYIKRKYGIYDTI